MINFNNGENNNNFTFISILILTLCELVLLNYTGGADRIIHEFDFFSNTINDNLKYDWFFKSINELNSHDYYTHLIESINQNLKISEYLRFLFFFLLRFLFYYSSVHILQLLGLTLTNAFFAILTIICIDIHNFFNPWLYSQLIFLDSGLSPRLISISIGYYSLYRALLYINFNKNINLYISSFLLGASTLFHVSNSFLIFLIYFSALFVYFLFIKRNFKEYYTLIIFLLLYVVGGGWFAINQVVHSISTNSNLETSYFIWLWVYFRAPYLRFDSVNPLISGSFFIIIFFVAIIILLFCNNYKRFKGNNNIYFISIVFYISLILCFSFFLSIKFSSSLLFSLYGIRQISILKFISLFFLFFLFQLFFKNYKIYLHSIILILFFITAQKNSPNSLMSYKKLFFHYSDSSIKIKNLQVLCKGEVLVEYDFPVSKFLIPTFVDFKKFGVNKYYMNEWQKRLNEVYNNQILQEYKKQKASNIYHTFYIDSDNSIFSNKNNLIKFLRNNKIRFLLLKNFSNTTSNFIIVNFYNDYTLYKFNNFNTN